MNESRSPLAPSALVGDVLPGLIVCSPEAPYENAKIFIRASYLDYVRVRLAYHGNEFFEWDLACWVRVDDKELTSRLYAFFGDATYLDAKEQLRPFNPTHHKVLEIRHAMAALTQLPADLTAPAWLDGPGPFPADEVIPFRGRLLHALTRTLLPSTPAFFAHYALPYEYRADAPAPTLWLRVLEEWWSADPVAISTLQEIVGYIVAGGTSLQKIFLIVGPTRSGKGIIARVLTAMIGDEHVAGPTLAGLGTNFGLWSLIGKPLAIISDARLSHTNGFITERLLTISGEDPISIDRKYKESWTGKLPTRLLITSNELPRLSDASGALASRFVLLVMTKSFYGREDPALSDKLLDELPGIFKWALEGWDRLRARGHFVQPDSSAEALRELEDLGSPVRAFVRERCVIGPGHSVEMHTVFNEWVGWCKEQRLSLAGSVQSFGRDLRAAVPGLTQSQPRTGETRTRRYEGIGLRYR